MPVLRNLIDHETAHGSRAFELWEGDITDPGFPVDILAVSYTRGSNLSTFRRPTVVGALISRHQINIHDLVRDSEYDLRPALGVCLSRKVKGVPFQRILCVELPHKNMSLSTAEVLENVFASLSLFEAKGIDVRTVALPLFGTGGLQMDPKPILEVLLPAAKKFIERSTTLERIAFFGFTQRIADLLDEAMNKILSRSRVTLPKEALITGLCGDIVTSFQVSRHLVKDKHLHLIRDVECVLLRDTVRSFEIGILGRRIAEMIAMDLLGSESGHVLARNIDRLKGTGVADWIVAYFNVLRNLGNESAHEAKAGERMPAFVSEGDLVVGLSCIHRLWEFWVEWKAAQKSDKKD